MWFDLADVDASTVPPTPSVVALNACLSNLANESSPRRLCKLVWFVLTFASGAERQLTVCYGTSDDVGTRINYRLAAYPPTVQLFLFMLGPIVLVMTTLFDMRNVVNWLALVMPRVAVRLANSGVASTVCLIFVKYCSVMMPRWMERWSRSCIGRVARRIATRCGRQDEVPADDASAAASAMCWRSLNPIAVHTEVRFFHPAVHVLSWLYFAMFFWILPISIVGMACFFPVFVVVGAAAEVVRRCLLWLRDWLKHRTMLLVSSVAPHDRSEDEEFTAAILRETTQFRGDAAADSPLLAWNVSASRGRDLATAMLFAVGVLKFIADQILPTIALVLSIQTALNYVVLAFCRGHLLIGTCAYYHFADPWWWTIVMVDYESRSLTCLLYTLINDFGRMAAAAGLKWQILSGALPFA
mgnify:FL=1